MAELEYDSDSDRPILDALRLVRPEDFQVHAPPLEIWAGIADHLAEQSDPVVVPPASRRRRPRTALIVGMVAVAAAAGVGLVWSIDPTPSTEILASAELTSDGLAGAPVGLRAEAEVVGEGSHRVLHLDLGTARPTSGEYLELWLIKPDISGMVSLGAVRADGDYDLPTGLEFRDYPVVDVSTEPYDGDPTHSGLSLLRGTLST